MLLEQFSLQGNDGETTRETFKYSPRRSIAGAILNQRFLPVVLTKLFWGNAQLPYILRFVSPVHLASEQFGMGLQTNYALEEARIKVADGIEKVRPVAA